jgi:hypothetical protein
MRKNTKDGADMIWVYIIVGAISGTLFAYIFRKLFKNESLINILTIFAVLITISLTRIYIIPYYYVYDIDNKIKNSNPIFALIADDSPTEFNVYVLKVKENILKQGNASNQAMYAATLVNSVLGKHIPTASNQSIYDYLKIETEIDKSLYKENPILVLVMEFTASFENTDYVSLLLNSKTMSGPLGNQIIKAKEEIIKSSININSQKSLTVEEKQHAENIFIEILKDLVKKYDKKSVLLVFQNPNSPELDKKIGAEIVISFYELLLAKGPTETGMEIKFIFLSQQPNS